MSDSIVWIDILTATPPESKRYLITTSPGKREVDILFYSMSRGWLNAETYQPVSVTYVLAWAHLPAPWNFREQRVISNLGD